MNPLIVGAVLSALFIILKGDDDADVSKSVVSGNCGNCSSKSSADAAKLVRRKSGVKSVDSKIVKPRKNNDAKKLDSNAEDGGNVASDLRGDSTGGEQHSTN